MNKELVDGLGYDESKQQYFTVVYGWKNIIPNQKKSTKIEIKSGISKYDVYHAMKSSVLTRGKQFEQKPLFGYKADRKYLPKDITLDQANTIVKKMDFIFKQSMIELKYDIRSTRKSIGTEFYCVDKETGIDEIKQQWTESLSRSIHLVTGKKDKSITKDITFLGSQHSVTKTISDNLKKTDKCIINIACGYGKGFLIYLAPFKWSKFKNKQIVIYYTHNIPATKQAALTHSKYDEGTKYQGKYKRITVCSENKMSSELIEYGIDNFSTNDTSLHDFIVDSISNNTKVLFYVNKRSAEAFNRVFTKASKAFSNAPVPGIIFDEAHEFTGSISGQATHPVVKSIGDCQVAVTATLRKRVNDTNRRWIYNDDVKYFGPVVVNITPQQAIEEGRNCEIKFKTVEVSNGRLGEEIMANRAIDTQIKHKARLIRGRVLHNIVSLVKSIKEDKRTHPITLAHQIVDVDHVMEALHLLQSEGIIPAKYKIISGKRKDGRESVVNFNNAEYAILVGNSWLLTGLDAPKTDAIIPLYDIGTVIGATQGIGRGQRIYKDKTLNVYITVDPSSNEVPVMLHVANEMMQGKNPYQSGIETDLELNPSDIIGSRRQRVITHEVDRDDAITGSIRTMWDTIYNEVHVSSNFGEVVRKLTGKYTNNDNKSKEEWYERTAKYKTVSECENDGWIAWAREQKWYSEWYASKGGRIFWDEKKAIDYLKKFKTRPDANKDRLGAQALLWLHRNNLSHLQSQIWSDFKSGRGYTENKKLSDCKLIQKVLSLSKQLKTVSYTKLANKLRELKVAASDKKVRLILIENNLI
jgi:superfamily II DNA or RNA helicase